MMNGPGRACIKSNMADDGFVVGKPDTFCIMLCSIFIPSDLGFLVDDESALDIYLYRTRRENGAVDSRLAPLGMEGTFEWGGIFH